MEVKWKERTMILGDMRNTVGAPKKISAYLTGHGYRIE